MSRDAEKQVIVVKQSNGCLWFFLFGWFYPLWLVVKAISVGTWRACAVVGSAIVHGTANISREFHARYGWRGWAILAGVVVVLALLDKLTVH